MSPTLFISYRRSQEKAVRAVYKLLEKHGVACWLDRQDIDELADFPQRIAQGLAQSHAVLVWWSRDYSESQICIHEFLLAWQMARQHPVEDGQRIWIVNPVESGDASHITAGDLGVQNFLAPPSGDGATWAKSRGEDMAALAAAPPLAAEGPRVVAQIWYGRPLGGPEFVGRGSRLIQIHTALFPARLRTDTTPSRVQLHGIPGVGKSALAAHYAKTFAAAYPGGIWWLDLSGLRLGRPGLDGRTQTHAQVLDVVRTAWLWAIEEALGPLRPRLLPELCRASSGRALDPAEVRERLQRQLAGASPPEPYLWVLDALPTIHERALLDEVMSFLCAPTPAGRTLLTCSDAFAVSGATAIAVPPLPAADGQRLLARYLPTPERRLHEGDVVAELVAEVEGHPLALVLLGEYARSSAQGFAAVLMNVRNHGSLASVEYIQRELMAEMGRLTPNLVAALLVGLEPLDSQAQQLIALASVCAPHVCISMSLLERAFRNRLGGDALQDAGHRELGWEGLSYAPLRTLIRASLLTLDGQGAPHVRVHPLVAQVVLRALHGAPDAEQRAVVDALVSRLAPLASDPAGFADLRADAPHAEAFLGKHPTQPSPAISARSRVLLAVGLSRLYQASGHPNAALRAAEQGVQLSEAHLGAEDRDRLRALIALYRAQAEVGELNASADPQVALIPVVAKAFGADGEEALELRSLLGATRYQQRRLIEAAILQRAVLADTRGLPPARRRERRAAMSALAATLYQQGQLAQARELQEELLLMLEREAPQAGAAHPDAVVALHDLAVTLLRMNEVEPAVARLRLALVHAEGCFGKDHPATRMARSTLADALVGLNDNEAAMELYQQALDDATGSLGPDHPECLITLSRLIGATGATGQLEVAHRLQSRFVESARHVLPAGHPDTLAAVEGLARAMNDLGQPIGHLWPLLQEVLQARLRDLGQGHIETVNAFSNLALALAESGEGDATLLLRRGALDAARALRGDTDERLSAILQAHMSLILLLDSLGEAAAAEDARLEAAAEMQSLMRDLDPH